jgi:hypothetical protein
MFMKQKDAIKIAITCIEKEYRSLAVHANLCTQYGADYPAALSAVERRKALLHDLLKQIASKF